MPARREPCMLNGHSSAKVGLEPGDIGKEPDVRAVRAGSTAREWTDPRMQGKETLAGSGIVTVRAGSTAVLKVPQGMRRRRGVTILDLLSHG